MIDLETRARAAGAAARDEARARATRMPVPDPEPGPRLRWWPLHGRDGPRLRGVRGPLVGALAGFAVVLVAVVVTSRLVGVGTPTIAPVAPPPPDPMQPMAVDGVLPVPPVGDALPAYLEDGTPVFVSHPADGDVVVVDPTNPHMGNKLVAYCPSSGWFESQYHGSRFSGWGDYTGGPAPNGLPVFPTELVDDGSEVRVTGPPEPGAERDEPNGPPQPQQGPSCGEGSPAGTSAPVAHDPGPDLPQLDADEVPTHRWVWAELVLGGRDDDPRVCDADGTCPAGAPAAVPSFVVPDPSGALVDRTPGVYLARAEGDGDAISLRRVAIPDRSTAGSAAPPPSDAARSQPLLPVPDRGAALAVQLADRTPVFVTHTEDGEVHVIDATSTHLEVNLVGWCPIAQRFEDRHGSQFDPDGGYAGGPAPNGLRTYPVEIVPLGETEAVRITGSARGGAARPDPLPTTTGTGCRPGDHLVHQPHPDRPPIEEPVQAGPEMWRWVRSTLRPDHEGELALCPVEASCEPVDDGEYCFGPTGTEECYPIVPQRVTTTGAHASDEPGEILLVRGSDNLRTVEVRRPFPTDGP